MVIPSPPDIESLVEAAKALGGQSIEALATRLEVEVPQDLRTHKGWLGELIERALGATAGTPRAWAQLSDAGRELFEATGSVKEAARALWESRRLSLIHI